MFVQHNVLYLYVMKRIVHHYLSLLFDMLALALADMAGYFVVGLGMLSLKPVEGLILVMIASI